jgi:ubiquinone/menaquinone biosynthesis C-methylase UbiE
MRLKQRLARLATSAVVRFPVAWWVFRGVLRRGFDRLAPSWDGLGSDLQRLAALEAALARLDCEPRRALDLGTGTGSAARLVAARWPLAEVVGVDLSAGMIEQARLHPAAGRERYEVADASQLPFDGCVFDLVTLNNMIPFFDELARVTAHGGSVAIAFSHGAKTPIWVPLERVEAELQRRGFEHVANFAAGNGVSLLARRAERA